MGGFRRGESPRAEGEGWGSRDSWSDYRGVLLPDSPPSPIPSSPPPTSPCPSEPQRMAEQHGSGRPVMWQAGGCGVLSVDIHSCFPGVSKGREGGMVGGGGGAH